MFFLKLSQIIFGNKFMWGIIEFFKRAKKQALGIFRTSTNTYRDKNWDFVLCPVSSISFPLLFAPPSTRVPIFTLVEIGVKLALDRYRLSRRDVPKSKIRIGIGFYQTPKFFRRIFCSVCNNPNVTWEQRSNISFKLQSFLVKRIVTPEKYRKCSNHKNIYNSPNFFFQMQKLIKRIKYYGDYGKNNNPPNSTISVGGVDKSQAGYKHRPTQNIKTSTI